MPTADPILREWRRIRGRIYRTGALNTARYVAHLASTQDYSAWCQYQLGDYLIKRGELEAADILLQSTMRYAGKHPLIDTLYIRWLWCMNRGPAAISYGKKAIKARPHFVLYDLMAAMYRVKGDAKLADKYVNLAISALKQEGH